MDRADGLESEFEKILQSDDQLKKLAGEMGLGDAAAAEAPAAEGNPEGGAT